MNYLLILNDPPYGTERSYNGLRLANELAKDEKNTVGVPDRRCGGLWSCGADDAQRILQHRANVEGPYFKAQQDRDLRELHGCAGHQIRSDPGRHPPEHNERADRLDTGSGEGDRVLMPLLRSRSPKRYEHLNDEDMEADMVLRQFLHNGKREG